MAAKLDSIKEGTLAIGEVNALLEGRAHGQCPIATLGGGVATMRGATPLI